MKQHNICDNQKPRHTSCIGAPFQTYQTRTWPHCMLAKDMFNMDKVYRRKKGRKKKQKKSVEDILLDVLFLYQSLTIKWKFLIKKWNYFSFEGWMK